MTDAETFETRLAAVADEIETTLDGLLTAAPRPGETARPERLIAAMRHATLGGGKRLRPFLVVECAALFGRSGAGVLAAAAALECVHCYSLAHDDLPAMDDDDLRRGRPTVHKAFDEATAILAGDALLTLAFEVLAAPSTDADPGVRAALVSSLARASGLAGMVGGQVLDLAAESADASPGEAQIRTLQAMKTGALITCACEIGALVGRAGDDERTALIEYGRTIGLAFQLADDLLDVEGEAEALGKATAKDAARGKATLVGLIGIDETRRQIRALVEQADAHLALFGARGAVLSDTARFIAERRR